MCYVPATRKEQTIAEIFAATLTIQRGGDRSKLLADLAPYLSEPLLLEVLEMVRASSEAYRQGDVRGASRANEDQYNQAWALVRLAPHLPEPQKEQVFMEALNAIRAIFSFDNRAEALAELVPHLPEHMLADALAMVQAISEPDDKARSLSRLAPYLPEPQKEQAFMETLNAIRAFPSYSCPVPALTNLVPHLSEPLLLEALEIAKAIENNRWDIKDATCRAEALTSFSPYISDPSVADALISIVQSTERLSRRAETLGEVAPAIIRQSSASAYLLWSQFLEDISSQSRVHLLKAIPFLVSTLAVLGEDQAILDTVTAVQDVRRWWP